MQAAYDVANAVAYATAYEAYRAGACRAASYANTQAVFGTAYADTSIFSLLGCGTYSRQAAIQAARTAYATYVDSAAYAAAYDAAHALFNAAYAADSPDPQAEAAQAYAAAAQAVAEADSRRVDTYRQAVRDSVYAARIAIRDSAYVTPPISIAIAALATSKTAYQACATHIDSILNSIE